MTNVRQGKGSTARTPTKMRRYRGLRSRADIKQVGFQAVKPTVGKVFRTVFVVRFGSDRECSLMQGGHFTAEAERSRQHCGHQQCGECVCCRRVSIAVSRAQHSTAQHIEITPPYTTHVDDAHVLDVEILM